MGMSATLEPTRNQMMLCFFCFSELFQVVTFQSSLDWIKRWTTDFGHEKWKNKLGSLHLEMRNEHSCKIHKWLVDFRTRLAVSNCTSYPKKLGFAFVTVGVRDHSSFFFQNWRYLHCIFFFGGLCWFPFYGGHLRNSVQ